MIIQNYGLHWVRRDVDWGRKGKGNQGDLLGRLSKTVKSPTIRFREQAGIYILQDEFKPIYIGQCGSGEQRLFGRLRDHTRNHLAERWNRFSWFGVYPVKGEELNQQVNVDKITTDVYAILDHLEGVLISVTEPPLNRQGAKFGDAQQYKQMPPPKAAVTKDDEDADDE